jgi:hypothetical protein
MEGDSFETASRLEEMDFPTIPRIGETITLPIEQRFRVVEVNYHKVHLPSKVSIALLVEHI